MVLVAAEPGRSFSGLNRSMGPADWPQATSLLHGTQQKRDRGGSEWVSGWMDGGSLNAPRLNVQVLVFGSLHKMPRRSKQPRKAL